MAVLFCICGAHYTSSTEMSYVTAGCWFTVCKYNAGKSVGGIKFYFSPDKVVRVPCRGKASAVSVLLNHNQKPKVFLLISQK